MIGTSLSERFRRARMAAMLSQEHAAEQMGVSRSFISQLENGRKGITIENLRRAVMVYGVSPTYLLGYTLPVYGEVAHHLRVKRGDLPAWYRRVAFGLGATLAEWAEFDAEAFASALGIPWGPAPVIMYSDTLDPFK